MNCGSTGNTWSSSNANWLKIACASEPLKGVVSNSRNTSPSILDNVAGIVDTALYVFLNSIIKAASFEEATTPIVKGKKFICFKWKCKSAVSDCGFT